MCRLTDKVIPARLRENVFVYLYDLLIVSPDFQTHMELLEVVAKCLLEAGLTPIMKKLSVILDRNKIFRVSSGQLMFASRSSEKGRNLGLSRTKARAAITTLPWHGRLVSTETFSN